MWKHLKKYKNRIFLGNYELNKYGKRVLKLKDAMNGKEYGPYSSHEAVKKLGFVKIK